MTLIQKGITAFFLAVLAIVSWVPAVNSQAEQIAEAGLKRTLATFAVVRTVSSTIAVLSSANVAVLKVGEALHPINKLVDQFLDVMLLASASFALQIIFLKIGSHWAVAGLLSIGLAYVGVMLFRPKNQSAAMVRSLVVLLILVRFAIPVTIFGTQAIYSYAIESREQSALEKIKSFSSSTALDGNDIAVADSTYLDRLKAKWASPGKMSRLIDSVKNAPNEFIDIIAGYILQSIILPLGFLYVFWMSARAAIR